MVESKFARGGARTPKAPFLSKVSGRTFVAPTGEQLIASGVAPEDAARLVVTIRDNITPALETIMQRFKSPAGRHYDGREELVQGLTRWAGGYSRLPPVNQFIVDEYFERRANPKRYGWPDKGPVYGARFPIHLREWGNLEKSVEKLRSNPQALISTLVPGGVSGVLTAAATGQYLHVVKLRLAEYFAAENRVHGPPSKRGMGVSYVWLFEFGIGGQPQKEFIGPALEKSVIHWELNWDVEVQGAAHILNNCEKVTAPIISSNVPGRTSPSAILYKARERHMNIFAMLLWLMPVNEYVSILAAIKDIRGFIKGGRGSFGSVKQWLESIIIGQSGMTVKAQRKKVRKGLWG